MERISIQTGQSFASASQKIERLKLKEDTVFEIYERLDKQYVVLQLRDGTGSVVEGFDYRVSITKIKNVHALKKMLERERDRRNRQIKKGSGGPQ